MINLYLIRHGSTRENEQKRYIGWTDAALSTLGTKQAKQLAAYFQHRDRLPTTLYCSDLKRTARTAEIIGSHHRVKPEASSLLRELNFGKWEGLTWEQINSTYPEESNLWLQDPYRHPPPEGESLVEMRKRTNRFLKRRLKTGQTDETGKNILIISHGGTIRLLLMQLLSLDPPEFWNINIGTASISLLKKSENHFCSIYINKTVYKEG